MIISIKVNSYKNINKPIELNLIKTSYNNQNRPIEQTDILNSIAILGYKDTNLILNLLQDLKDYIVNKNDNLIKNIDKSLLAYFIKDKIVYEININKENTNNICNLTVMSNNEDIIDENSLRNSKHLNDLICILSNINLKYNLNLGSKDIDLLTSSYNNTDKQFIYTTKRSKICNKLDFQNIYVLDNNDFYSLCEFKDIKNYRNVHRGFLEGRFGGIRD